MVLGGNTSIPEPSGPIMAGAEQLIAVCERFTMGTRGITNWKL
jgi:hypothetical protein